jgi:ATP-dependent protease HslVU (ClpYQ) peptidase subunit
VTTVAWDGVTLAADGRVTDESTLLCSRSKKILRVPKTGELVGVAGTASDTERLLDWARSGLAGDPPAVEDAVAIVVRRDRTVWITENGARLAQVEAPFAIGSGRDSAFTAMDLGCNAIKAVRMAAKRDPSTGGQVRSLKLKEAPCQTKKTSVKRT